jgi:hypothetical protein
VPRGWGGCSPVRQTNSDRREFGVVRTTKPQGPLPAVLLLCWGVQGLWGKRQRGTVARASGRNSLAAALTRSDGRRAAARGAPHGFLLLLSQSSSCLIQQHPASSESAASIRLQRTPPPLVRTSSILPPSRDGGRV